MPVITLDERDAPPVASTSQVESASVTAPAMPERDPPLPESSSESQMQPVAAVEAVAAESARVQTGSDGSTSGAKKVDANLKVWKPYSGMPPRIRLYQLIG